MRVKALSIFVCFFLLETTFADEEASQPYYVTTVATGLNYPWSLVFLPNQAILVAEKRGTLRLISPNGEVSSPIELPAIHMIGQGGLMDLTLHPNFRANKLVYYSFTYKSNRLYGTAIGRFRIDEGKVTKQETVFTADNLGSSSRHFGSRIVFDKEGYLYLCLGDRGERDEAQNLANHKGTILRLKDDGSTPPDNPFVGVADAREEIFSYGHRNLQGCVFYADRLWTHEHGPRGGDELNIIRRGANYGWPVITYGRAYSGFKIGEGTHKDGMEQPLVYWVPSIAPSGMIIYDGTRFPQWQGNIFIGALAGQHLRRVGEIQAEVIQEELLKGEGRIREVAQDSHGYIYVLTDYADGRLLRLQPANR